jgi:hypothetical protein
LLFGFFPWLGCLAGCFAADVVLAGLDIDLSLVRTAVARHWERPRVAESQRGNGKAGCGV